MKVSQIIELALNSHYSPVRPFMCNSVEHLVRMGTVDVKDAQLAIDAIDALLKKIAGPGNYPWATLVNTLRSAGYLTDRNYQVNMPYTTELYVWWVFDLKNKGL